jgi:hypothetical protein
MDNVNDYSTNVSQSSMACPQCNHVISYFDKRKSTFFGCPQCGCFFESLPTGKLLLRTFDEPDRVPPSFPLGTTGFIDEKTYTLVGYMYKKEADDDIYWKEYAFYSPGEEWYVILAEYNGHWMLVKRSANQDIEAVRSITAVWHAYAEDVTYELYLTYKLKMVYAEGEFDWNILTDEELDTFEYVAAPNLLICEQRNGKNDWFRGYYYSPSLIMQMFKVEPEWFPPRPWPAPFTPSTFYPRWKPLYKFSAILLGLMALVCLANMGMKPTKQVFSNSYTIEPDTASWGSGKTIVTPAFDIQGPAALAIKMGSDAVDNNWMELSASLINDKDGKVYEVGKTIEYYHGYEDGDSWSEGSREEEADLSSIPSGTYHLNIYPYTEQKDRTSPLTFYVSVTQNYFVGRNFWLMLSLIVVYPIVQLIRKYRFENSKWFDKEYGSFKNE